MATSIELKFADGDYLFALKVPQILELQRVCGAGIFVIYGRLLKGRYVLQSSGLSFGAPHECEAYLNDVLETVRLALIGGGQGRVNATDVQVTPLRARELVDTYCFPATPLKETWDLAAAILATTMEGYDEPSGQKKSPAPARQKGSTKRKSSQTAP